MPHHIAKEGQMGAVRRVELKVDRCLLLQPFTLPHLARGLGGEQNAIVLCLCVHFVYATLSAAKIWLVFVQHVVYEALKAGIGCELRHLLSRVLRR